MECPCKQDIFKSQLQWITARIFHFLRLNTPESFFPSSKIDFVFLWSPVQTSYGWGLLSSLASGMLQLRVLTGCSANPLQKKLEKVLGKPCLIGLHLHFYRHISLLAYRHPAVKTAKPLSFPLMSSWWPPWWVHREKKYPSLVPVYMTLQSGQLDCIPLYNSSLVVPKYQFRLPPHWKSFSSVFHQHRPTLHAKVVTENIKYHQSPEWSLKKLQPN